jgi:hypothetical protein
MKAAAAQKNPKSSWPLPPSISNHKSKAKVGANQKNRGRNVISSSPTGGGASVTHRNDETKMQQPAPAIFDLQRCFGLLLEKPIRTKESQTVLFCVGEDSADYSIPSNEHEISTVRFSNTASFIHWLFSQSRGDITPWATLVVGWREAKPCAMAISAAISGDANKLRPDARRPELEPVPEGTTTVRVAVDTVFIIARQDKGQTGPEQLEMPKWALADDMGSLDISLVTDVNDLSEKLGSLRRTIRL